MTKATLFSLLLLCSYPAMTSMTTTGHEKVSSEFEDGWKEGYCEGWKYVCGPGCTCPSIPNAPSPLSGMDRYKDGYNAGFTAGSKAARR
jgi:hypothetical protein